MGQWSGIARSNYVKVKDLPGLTKALEGLEIEIQPHLDLPDMVAFFPSRYSEDGDFPTMENDDGIGVQPFDWQALVVPYLEDTEVLVVMTVGFERRRYVTGNAMAYTKDMQPVQVDLSDIYDKAAKIFGLPKSEISTADC